MLSPSLAFAEVDTDKSIYAKGELVKISGTLDLQNGAELVEVKIIDPDGNEIINQYVTVDDDNAFSGSYEIVPWTTGKYEVIISYNGIVEDSAEFEVVSSSSEGNDEDSNVSDDINDEKSDNNQQNSSSVTLSDTVPASPIDLKANVVSSTQIDLSWSIYDDNDSSITGFKIEARINTDPNYSIIMENTGNTNTAYSHTNLIPDTIYAYRVSAINSVGESEPSSGTTVKTSSDSISLENRNIEGANVPTDVVARVISPTSIELSWNPPSQTYGQTINGYIIKQEIASGVYNEIATTVGSGTAYTVSNLITGESYAFVVSANYLRGSSDVSEKATITLSSPSTSNSRDDDNGDSDSVLPSGVPDSPNDLKIQPVLSTQIDLSWSAPESDSDNNNSITGYKIEARTTNSFYSTVIEDTENTDTKYSHTDLIPNTTYIYRVYAINDIGTSEPSSEQLANTLITDPEEEESDSSATQDNDDNANNDANISPSTNIPSQPVDLQAIPISQNRINLSWSAPIDSGLSSPLLGYKIESKTSEESDYSILVTNTGNASITLYSHTGLTAGLTYQYRVSAINSSGEGVPSDIVEAIIVSADGDQVTDESQSQQSSISTTLQPQVTLSTDKSIYGPNDSIEVSGTANNSDETIPLGLRVISSDDVIVYARSISINNDNSFEAIISPLQRQSSVWQIDGEFTVEVTYDGRIQATAIFMNDGNDNAGNSLPTSNESNNDITGSNEQSSSQLSPQTPSTNDPIVTSNNELEILKNQNTRLQYTNQQLQDENNQFKTHIDELNKRIEQLDIIIKEQIRVMMETLGVLKSEN